MPTIWFCMPVHGRLALAAICLRQLRRTCETLAQNGVQASAVVVSDRDSLDRLDAETGGWYAAVERSNDFLSAKYNDAIQLACDPAFNPRPADYVVPCGSDDFVDWRLFTRLPKADTIVGFQRVSFVREDGVELAQRYLRYEGGCGIRIIPRQLLGPAGYRPADEDRRCGCDTSILVNLRRLHGDRLKVAHRDSDARQIVDWKTAGENLNPYEKLRMHREESSGDPFAELAEVFPAEALAEMRAHYQGRALVAA